MGLFGGLGKSKAARGIAGAIGDALLMNNGRAPVWAPAMAEERKRQRELEAQRAAIEPAIAALVARGVSPQEAAVIAQGGGADALLAQHNKPQSEADDVFTRTLIAAGIDPNSEQGRTLYAQRANTMASPAPQMIGSPETGYQWVQPPGMALGGNPAPSGASSPPPQAIEALRNNPSLQGDFDRKYGPGSAARVLGGGAGNGSGTFQFFGRRTRF